MRTTSFEATGLCAVLLGAASLVACKAPTRLAWAMHDAPPARVDQLGYLPRGPKRATIATEGSAPLTVELRQGEKVLWTGLTTPFGRDAASGDNVQRLDFSDFGASGSGYQLRVGDKGSQLFSIGDNVYERLPYDALKYFYHNRSGVPIVRPYVLTDEWARQPGHLSDAQVPCLVGCSYTLNVAGGWYDAGDQGKYVVNGGISTWTLLSMHARFAQFAAGLDAFGDGSLNIPESRNGVPDLLDEARFELEFLLAMQVPEGEQNAGLVHHKIHDRAWTPLPFEPPSRATGRALHPPSTAATLNLAAVAAQAARIFERYDAAFATRCRTAARRAYAAALAHPALFASEQDNQGGGPYSDRIVSDEFYWARSELWLLEPSEELWAEIQASPHHRAFPTRLEHEDGSFDADGVTTSFTWQSTAALGWISLALTPSPLGEGERDRLRRGIVEAADVYAVAIEKQGYLVPVDLGPSGLYPWGSNSVVLNNMVVLSLAADLTHHPRYGSGVVAGLNYLLGNNPLLFSYVSGYGETSLQNPHHRFWAHSKDRHYPRPPPGAVSGGPNSSLQDPQTKKSGLSKGLPPMKCYVDHIEAWSVNEVAINWNAPLAWTAAFVDQWRGDPPTTETARANPPK